MTRTRATTQLRQVTDTAGRRYTLNRLIGAGGQGAVYELKEGKLAAKLLAASGEDRHERLCRRLQMVRHLQLEGLPVASPMAVLKPPHIGYVMKLVAGMEPMRHLMQPPKDGGSVSGWFLKTGGLRGRLFKLGAVAQVLSRLHGRGLAYGDPSPENILMAGDPEETALFLIDADNLRSESAPTCSTVFTPGYGAPELVRGERGTSTLTDAFSFAVIAFETLTLVHPFVGNAVAEGEPELEEAAFRGDMPWIEHGSDTRNRSSRGLPRELVISPELLKLFQATFESGLTDAMARPGLTIWTEKLQQAGDMTLVCARCSGSYFTRSKDCPWCGEEKPGFRLATFHLWDGSLKTEKKADGFVRGADGRKRAMAGIILTSKRPVLIQHRHILSDPSLEQLNTPILEAVLKQADKVELRNLGQEELVLAKHTPGQTAVHRLRPGEARMVPVTAQEPHWYLHFGELDQLHRAVHF